MNVRSLDTLNRYLDDDLYWRKKELTTLNLMLHKCRPHEKEILLKAGTCILYAHWEGFIKSAATGYVQLVARQGLRLRDLKPNFVALALRSEISSAGKPNESVTLVEKLLSGLLDRARIDWEGSISAGSNLNFERFLDILKVLGLDETPYDSKKHYIDRKLLEKRNLIAHGERVNMDEDEYEEVRIEITGLVQRFRDDVENAAATEAFLSTAS